MTRKKISNEKCLYQTITIIPEQKKLWDMQKKINPLFNLSAWVREQTFKCFSEESVWKGIKEEHLKKVEEADSILKAFEDERQKDLDIIHVNRFWWVRAAYLFGEDRIPKVIQKFAMEYKHGSGMKIDEKTFVKYLDIVHQKYKTEIQQVNDNPQLSEIDEYKKVRRVEQ